MPTYSLLQESLDQVIGLEALEEASDSIRSIVRADCAAMRRDFYGVVVAGLPHQEAFAFQSALARRGYGTKVVDDAEVPVLHQAMRVQRADLADGKLSFTSAMGRTEVREVKELVFVAAGFIQDQRWVTKGEMIWEPVRFSRDGLHVDLKYDREEGVGVFPMFQMDFFFWSMPNRVQVTVTENSVGFFQGELLRLKKPEGMVALMRKVAMLMLRERMNTGMDRGDSSAGYPSVHAYEEEIRWHFHRLKEAG